MTFVTWKWDATKVTPQKALRESAAAAGQTSITVNYYEDLTWARARPVLVKVTVSLSIKPLSPLYHAIHFDAADVPVFWRRHFWKWAIFDRQIELAQRGRLRIYCTVRIALPSNPWHMLRMIDAALKKCLYN